MTKEIYTLVIRSNVVDTQNLNSGSRIDGKYRVLWSQILPSKYKKFLVKSYFKATAETNDTNAFNTIYSVNVHTNLTNIGSYDTFNGGPSRLLCSAEKISSNIVDDFDVGYISRFGDSPPIVITPPTESYLEVKLFDSDGTTALTNTAFPMEYILILTFEAIE